MWEGFSLRCGVLPGGSRHRAVPTPGRVAPVAAVAAAIVAVAVAVVESAALVSAAAAAAAAAAAVPAGTLGRVRCAPLALRVPR